MTEADKLTLLKDLLLTDDRAYTESIHAKIKQLEDLIHKQQRLSNKVNPIIDEKLEEFTKQIPKTLGSTITKTLSEQIRNSKDQVVEALYPIMGKMIKKYIALFQKLSKYWSLRKIQVCLLGNMQQQKLLTRI